MTKVAIVTGSSSGIGAACALELSRRGWSVVVNYAHNAAEAQKVVAQCRDAIAVQADVGEDADCRRLAQSALDKWGRIDGLVNNAGTTKLVKHTDLEGLSAEDFQRIYRLNVVGPFQMTRACASALKASKGAVVNVSSVASLLGTGSSVAYAASKAALNAMTLSLARTLAPEVRVNAVAPGPILLEEGAGEAAIAAVERATPLGRLGGPEAVATAVLFLLGHDFMTGETIRVDGGRSLK